jgi:3-deoxy-D-manno-octulosonic acid kinase
MVKPSQDYGVVQRITWKESPAGAMLYDSRMGDLASPKALLPVTYGDRAQPVAAGGRQAAWFVDGDGWRGVLRGYRRGGLVARISQDAYLWQGEARTRSFREYRLLAFMREQGLRVPAPLAAAYWRQGLTYRASIVVERIPDVRPLAHVLDEPVWEATAAAIVDMHRLGVWHADLNAFNILIDAYGQAWIIDFDRGTADGVSAAERSGNMFRLRRSLKKVAGERGEAFWAQVNASYRQLSRE